MPVNSLYFTAVQLAIDFNEAKRKPLEYQMTKWTLDQILDELELFGATHQWEQWPYSVETPNPRVGKLLDIPVRINEELKDTQVILLAEKENPFDRQRVFVVKV